MASTQREAHLVTLIVTTLPRIKTLLPGEKKPRRDNLSLSGRLDQIILKAFQLPTKMVPFGSMLSNSLWNGANYFLILQSTIH